MNEEWITLQASWKKSTNYPIIDSMTTDDDTYL